VIAAGLASGGLGVSREADSRSLDGRRQGPSCTNSCAVPSLSVCIFALDY
jgi:hypothetical protein